MIYCCTFIYTQYICIFNYLHMYVLLVLGGVKNISFSILPASYHGITVIPSLKVMVGH